MRLPFILLGRDEVIRGLRLNVSDLQKRLNRTRAYADTLQRTCKRVREQQRADRVYLDRVKTEAWLVVTMIDQRVQGRELTNGKNGLLRALEGRDA